MIRLFCTSKGDYSSRSMKLLRILLCMTVCINNCVCESDAIENNPKSLQTLCSEAFGYAPKVLKALYYELSKEDKEMINIDLDNYDIPMAYTKIHVHLMNDNRYSKIESANFSDIDLDIIPAFLISKMNNLKKVNLRNNLNFRFKSEEFKTLCKQLVELDVSNCNIDEETFGIICNNSSKLEVLRISNNPRIKFCHQKEVKFKRTQD